MIKRRMNLNEAFFEPPLKASFGAVAVVITL